MEFCFCASKNSNPSFFFFFPHYLNIYMMMLRVLNFCNNVSHKWCAKVLIGPRQALYKQIPSAWPKAQLGKAVWEVQSMPLLCRLRKLLSYPTIYDNLVDFSFPTISISLPWLLEPFRNWIQYFWMLHFTSFR